MSSERYRLPNGRRLPQARPTTAGASSRSAAESITAVGSVEQRVEGLREDTEVSSSEGGGCGVVDKGPLAAGDCRTAGRRGPGRRDPAAPSGAGPCCCAAITANHDLISVLRTPSVCQQRRYRPQDSAAGSGRSLFFHNLRGVPCRPEPQHSAVLMDIVPSPPSPHAFVPPLFPCTHSSDITSLSGPADTIQRILYSSSG